MNAFKNLPVAATVVLGLGLLFAPGQATLAQTPTIIAYPQRIPPTPPSIRQLPLTATTLAGLH